MIEFTTPLNWGTLSKGIPSPPDCSESGKKYLSPVLGAAWFATTEKNNLSDELAWEVMGK